MSSAEIAKTDNATYTTATASQLASYLLTGLFFGVLLVKSEAASWFRIQEMFRFQNIHMFGLLGSAIATGMISTTLLYCAATATLARARRSTLLPKLQAGHATPSAGCCLA